MKASFLALIALSLGAPAPAAIAQDHTANEAAIRANLQTYLTAYRAKDGAALAALWSETGDFVSPLSGDSIEGREAIAAEYGKMFEGGGEVALEAEIENLRFLADDVAVEDGIAKVIRPGEAPSVASYRVLHVKRDDKWLIDSVRETILPAEAKPEPPVDGEVAIDGPLKELAWLIGDWVDEGEGSSIYLSAEWAMGGSYIKREFDVVVGEQIEMEGVEVIGWDPIAEKVRSWVFDSGGGFGSADWSVDGTTWTKRLGGTTADGRKLYAVHVITKVDDDNYRWLAHSRSADGELLPNIEPVTVKRISE